MDLGQLKYFIKIVEHGSFTRAAQDCSVSQPALSQQIAKLEKELGQPLFERQGRSIRVTPAGHVLRGEAEKILQLVDDVKRQITDDGQTGRICVGAIPTIGPYLLPGLLRSLRSQFTLASFAVNEHVTDDLLKVCSNGEVDVGFLAMPANAKYLNVEPFFEEELLLALPAEHALVKHDRIEIDDIRDEPFVLLDEAHCLSETVESFCNTKRFQPVATSKIQQLLTVQNLVALGHGISLIPKMACQVPASPGVVYRSLASNPPTRTIGICWNPYRYQSQLLTNFLKAIRELGDPKLMHAADDSKVQSAKPATPRVRR